jgi:hypothetical protein
MLSILHLLLLDDVEDIRSLLTNFFRNHSCPKIPMLIRTMGNGGYMFEPAVNRG